GDAAAIARADDDDIIARGELREGPGERLHGSGGLRQRHCPFSTKLRISECAIEWEPGTVKPSGCRWFIIARTSSRENQRASHSSSSSRVTSVESASAQQPIIRECGNGQGWVAK